MAGTKIFHLTLCLIICIISTDIVHGQIKCCQCTYPPVDECRDSPGVNHLGTCPSGTWCLTTRSKEFGVVEVSRSCALQETPPNNKTECVQDAGSPRYKCFCKGDACNSVGSSFVPKNLQCYQCQYPGKQECRDYPTEY